MIRDKTNETIPQPYVAPIARCSQIKFVQKSKVTDFGREQAWFFMASSSRAKSTEQCYPLLSCKMPRSASLWIALCRYFRSAFLFWSI